MQFATDHEAEPVALTLHGFGRRLTAGPAPSSANLERHRQAAADQLEAGDSVWGTRGGSIPIEYCHAGLGR